MAGQRSVLDESDNRFYLHAVVAPLRLLREVKLLLFFHGGNIRGSIAATIRDIDLLSELSLVCIAQSHAARRRGLSSRDYHPESTRARP